MKLKCEASLLPGMAGARQHIFYFFRFFVSRFVGVAIATALCCRVKVEWSPRRLFNALVPQPRDGSAAGYSGLRRLVRHRSEPDWHFRRSRSTVGRRSTRASAGVGDPGYSDDPGCNYHFRLL
jgi:hypothetical protein